MSHVKLGHIMWIHLNGLSWIHLNGFGLLFFRGGLLYLSGRWGSTETACLISKQPPRKLGVCLAVQKIILLPFGDLRLRGGWFLGFLLKKENKKKMLLVDPSQIVRGQPIIRGHPKAHCPQAPRPVRGQECWVRLGWNDGFWILFGLTRGGLACCVCGPEYHPRHMALSSSLHFGCMGGKKNCWFNFDQ